MENQTFNPKEWLEKSKTFHDSFTQAEKLTSLIEASQSDITAGYSRWLNIGFALAHEFGERGRELFHRLSRFNPGYSQPECDKQYDACLKAKGGGVTIGSFFHFAREAGFSLQPLPVGNHKQPEDQDEQEENRQMPVFPGELFDPSTYTTLPDWTDCHFAGHGKMLLPGLLQQVVSLAGGPEERDMLLLGAITAISSCMPNLFGIYDGRKVYSNLYLFVVARASAGKGRLVHCRQLVQPVHRELRMQARLLRQQYDADVMEYNAKKGSSEQPDKPERPGEKLLFIPANSSSTGAYQLLGDNDGQGLIFETEGDTLANAFASDYGNYSDGFRKAFHHETITYYRRGDREYVDIEFPRLSTVLTGTPRQVASLIPGTENGLFSRFMFYYLNFKPFWKDVFAGSKRQGYDQHFEDLGKAFHELYKQLKAGPERQFFFTPTQESWFNEFFEMLHNHYHSLAGIEYITSIRRLGLVAFRICMVLTALRMGEQGRDETTLVCSDEDFRAAMAMIRVLVKHSSMVFSEMIPEEEKPRVSSNRREKLLDALPAHFSRKDYLEVAASMKIPDNTADKYIGCFVRKGLLERSYHDHYSKITPNTPQAFHPTSGEEENTPF